MKALEIATLMAEMLDLDDIETEDNFFDIGGDSILALSLIEELYERCQVRVSLLDVIRCPTPEDLAGRIARNAVRSR